jgi:hypothetical protein
MRRHSTPLALALAVSVAALLAACGDDVGTTGSGGGEGGSGGAAQGGAGGGTGGGEGGTAPTGLPPKESLTPGAWNELATGGETLCSRGTPYAFWVRPGTTNRVVLDFIGGGACWNALTCSVAGSLFSEDVEGVRQAVEANQPEGIYDHDRADNPLGDAWHVIVPYCTGDIHWGDSVTTYGEGADAVTIHHKGAVNSRAVLAWVFENFAAPEQVFVTGCSAGSYGSLLWSAHVMEHYPTTRVVQFGDSGAGIITQDFFQNSFPSWNAEPAFPAWIPALDPASIDLASKQLSDLYVGVSNHYPAQTMSQYNTVRDETQVFFFKAMGGADEAAWTAAMQASIDDIESRASRFASFTAPGDQHCILPYDNFYTVEADGVRLVDWIASMIADPDVPMSVACQGAECDQPTP